MIRSLRRRFILSAMAAFGILLVLLISGLGISGYLRVENTTEMLMEEMLDADASAAQEDPAPRPDPKPEPAFLHSQTREHIPHYIITATAEGAVSDVSEKGIWEPDIEAAGEYALQILESGQEGGRIETFKFRLRRQEDGSARIVLLDDSMQLRMLVEMLESASLIGLACLALLFLILLPISVRVVRSYAANIEKQRRFITDAGHEIKTPVAIIMSNVDAMELLQGENKWSRNIRGQTERLSALLQRMLFLARTDETSAALPMKDLDLIPLLQAELEAYEEMLAERGLNLHSSLPASLRLRGNRENLQQLVHVLMDNAVQYAQSGEICLQVEKRRKRARILLENGVESLPDCAPEALFDRFYRGDSARTQSGGGYGIGLSAARAIAQMHRGRIWAEYDGQRKIRFIVELPVKG